MKKIYIVFDKIPKKEDGGLIATYIDFVKEFESECDIEFISIFKSDRTNIEEFDNVPILTIIDSDFDNRFYRIFSYLRSKNIHSFFLAMKSIFLFFCTIPFVRFKMKRQCCEGDYVIAPAPASAIFISNKIKFILEIHTNYEYFWGNHPIGRFQTMLMARPAITVFRNSIDKRKSKNKFRSTYIYNCFNDKCLVDKSPIKRKRNSAVFVGRLVEQKQPLKLLLYAEKVRKLIPDFSLDIYGDGPLKGQLQEEIERRELQETVFLKGFTSDKSVYSCYDVAWLASSFEGFGLVIIEAMANNVPTISTEWGEAVWEIIQDGRTGIIAKTDEEFIQSTINLLENKKMRDYLAKNAREDYEKRFSPNNHKEAWEKLFKEIYED